MVLVVKHNFVSGVADGADPTQIQPSHWNDSHTLSGSAAISQVDGLQAALDAKVSSNSLSAALTSYITSASSSAAITTALGPYMTSNSMSAAVVTDALTVRGTSTFSATAVFVTGFAAASSRVTGNLKVSATLSVGFLQIGGFNFSISFSPTVSDGQVLTWSGASSQWVNANPPGAAGGEGSVSISTMITTALAGYITSLSSSAAITAALGPYMTSNSISLAVVTDSLTVRGTATFSGTAVFTTAVQFGGTASFSATAVFGTSVLMGTNAKVSATLSVGTLQIGGVTFDPATYITSASSSAAITAALAGYMTSNSISAAVVTDVLTVRGTASFSASTFFAASVLMGGNAKVSATLSVGTLQIGGVTFDPATYVTSSSLATALGGYVTSNSMSLAVVTASLTVSGTATFSGTAVFTTAVQFGGTVSFSATAVFGTSVLMGTNAKVSATLSVGTLQIAGTTFTPAEYVTSLSLSTALGSYVTSNSMSAAVATVALTVAGSATFSGTAVFKTTALFEGTATFSATAVFQSGIMLGTNAFNISLSATVSDGQFLQFNGVDGKWRNVTSTGGGEGSVSISTMIITALAPYITSNSLSAAVVTASLTVGGTSTFSGTAVFTTAVQFGGTASFSATAVFGTSVLMGTNAKVSATLSVGTLQIGGVTFTPASYLTSDSASAALATVALTVAGSATFSGTAVFKTTAIFEGTTTFSATAVFVTGARFTGPTFVSGTLSVGTLQIAGTTFTPASYLTSASAVTAITTGTLIVGGTASFSATAVFLGAVQFAATVSFSATAVFAGTAQFLATATFSATAAFLSGAIFGAATKVSGTLSVSALQIGGHNFSISWSVLTDGHVVTWNAAAGQWINAAAPGASGGEGSVSISTMITNRFAASITFSATVVTLATAMIIGDGTGGSFLALNGSATAGVARGVFVQSTGLNRWAVGADVTAESGSDAGSDFRIKRYNDAGSSLGDPVYITRSTGDISISANVNIKGGVTISGTLAVNTTPRYVTNGGVKWPMGGPVLLAEGSIGAATQSVFISGSWTAIAMFDLYINVLANTLSGTSSLALFTDGGTTAFVSIGTATVSSGFRNFTRYQINSSNGLHNVVQMKYVAGSGVFNQTSTATTSPINAMRFVVGISVTLSLGFYQLWGYLR